MRPRLSHGFVVSVGQEGQIELRGGDSSTERPFVIQGLWSYDIKDSGHSWPIRIDQNIDLLGIVYTMGLPEVDTFLEDMLHIYHGLFSPNRPHISAR